MTIAVGSPLPDVTIRLATPEGPQPRQTSELFKGKTMVLFGVPGAFTPTCHKNHLPGFLENAHAFKAKGVDGIAVIAVNDPFVMGAWEQATDGAGKIHYLSDGNGDFARAIGLELDASGAGLGLRNKRFSMLVQDGVVKVLNVEDAPGKAEISGAAALLSQI